MEDQGKRILLFVVIAAAIFFGWQWLFPQPKQPPPAEKPAAGETAQPSMGSPVGRPQDGAESAPSPPATTPVAEQSIVLESEGVRVTFSNVGGVIKEWVVLHDPVKGRVMNEHLFVSDRPQLGLGATNFLKSTTVIPPGAEWQGERLSDRKVRYTYRTDAIKVVKDFELFPADFVVKMSVEVSVPKTGPAAARQQLAVSLFGHAMPETGGRRAKVPTGAICFLNGEVSTISAKDLQRGPRERGGRVGWIGLSHQYDLVALAPRPTDEALACNAYPLEGVKDGMQVDLVFSPAQLAAGDVPLKRDMVMYVGPKYIDKLENVDQIAGFKTHIDEVVDFGWFSFISRPMLWLLHRLYEVVHNWGLAIILLTCLVKLATLYWTTKSMRSMKAMAALRPQIEEIQKKYPDDRAKQQQAQMDLFKQHGVSPLSGCLPMLLQMPIWLALYKMLSVAGELHQAVFIPGWLDDLTARDPYFILPITLTAAMFLQSRLQPAATDSAQQKILMYGLPLMFGFMGLYFPSGLGVYMLTNTLLGIGHTLYMKRTDKGAAAKVVAGKPAAGKDAGKAELVGKGEAAGAKVATVEAADDEGEDDEDEGEEPASPAAKPGAATGAKRGGSRSKRRGKRR